MRTTKDFQLNDGEVYTMGQWDPDKASEILAWIMTTVGPTIAPGIRAAIKNNGDVLDMDLKDLDFQTGAMFFEGVMQHLPKAVSASEYSMRLKQILTGDLMLNGKALNYNFHFRGRLKDAHLLALEVLKYQFADFIEGGASIFAGFVKKTASRPLSQVNNLM